MRREPSRWNQALAKVLFAWGCLATLVGLLLQFIVVLSPDSRLLTFLERGEPLPIWYWLLVTHSATFVVTFARDPAAEYEPRWAPLIYPSEKAVLIGRLIIGAAAGNLFLSPLLMGSQRDPLPAAMLLLSAAYTAVHWALRPENIFSWKVLGVLRNGLYPLLFDWWLRPTLEKRYARRDALPLNEWLTGLLECCETAAKGGRLVNSESPAPGEVDCLEFQYQLLDELESRAGVVHHRKELSQDGFREIRQFVRAVEALRHREPDQEQWQNVARDARSVLAIRDKLKAR